MIRFLRTSAVVIVLALGAALALQPFLRHRPRDAKPTELFDVVWQQVNAFRAQDYATAYRQVSLDFQGRCDIDSFTDLVHSDYPPLRWADRAEFGPVRWDGSKALVQVYFFMPDREIIPCFYSLVMENGVWKIDDLQVLKRWRTGRRLGGIRT